MTNPLVITHNPDTIKFVKNNPWKLVLSFANHLSMLLISATLFKLIIQIPKFVTSVGENSQAINRTEDMEGNINITW